MTQYTLTIELKRNKKQLLPQRYAVCLRKFTAIKLKPNIITVFKDWQVESWKVFILFTKSIWMSNLYKRTNVTISHKYFDIFSSVDDLCQTRLSFCHFYNLKFLFFSPQTAIQKSQLFLIIYSTDKFIFWINLFLSEIWRWVFVNILHFFFNQITHLLPEYEE